jgi:hypothetical protein
MFKGGTQRDGLHHSAVTLVSPIAEVDGEGFKFHRAVFYCNKLEKYRKGGKPFLQKSPAISQGFELTNSIYGTNQCLVLFDKAIGEHVHDHGNQNRPKSYAVVTPIWSFDGFIYSIGGQESCGNESDHHEGIDHVEQKLTGTEAVLEDGC